MAVLSPCAGGPPGRLTSRRLPPGRSRSTSLEQPDDRARRPARRRPDPRREGVAHRGRRHVVDDRDPAPRDPVDQRDRRPERRAREGAVRPRRRDRGVRAVRLGARRHVGPRARRAGRRDARRGGAHQGVPRAARADRQHAPLAHRRAELRVLLGGSAAVRAHRRGLRARRAVAGRRDDGEALRRQRRRVRAQPDELGGRLPRAARDHPGAVRARGDAKAARSGS